jgi:branched-chain amino acid transport system ATP-binding protein
MTTEASTLLAVSDLSKVYAGIRAVDGLSLTVSTGEIVGLIGPNGCGKSTTIDCITGFTRPTSGKVLLRGQDISGLPAETIAAAGMSRTFQNVRVYDRLSLLENLAIARQSFDRMPWWHSYLNTITCRHAEDRAREKARTLVRLIGLAALAEAPAGLLSYGQKKLLALAMTLMGKPRLVILDEPLAGVNPTVIRRVADLIRELNAGGITFLIVEHNVQFIMQHCQRVIVMEQGRELANGEPAIIRQDERVLRAYLGSGQAVDRELAYHE